MNNTIAIALIFGIATVWVSWGLLSLSSLAASHKKLADTAERIARALEKSRPWFDLALKLSHLLTSEPVPQLALC